MTISEGKHALRGEKGSCINLSNYSNATVFAGIEEMIENLGRRRQAHATTASSNDNNAASPKLVTDAKLSSLKASVKE